MIKREDLPVLSVEEQARIERSAQNLRPRVESRRQLTSCVSVGICDGRGSGNERMFFASHLGGLRGL